MNVVSFWREKLAFDVLLCRPTNFRIAKPKYEPRVNVDATPLV